MNRFIFVTYNGIIYQYLFEDLKKLDNVAFHPTTGAVYRINNKLMKGVFRLHNSDRINKYINLPFKSIWYRYFYLSQFEYAPEDTYFIVFMTNTANKYKPEYLNYLKRKHQNIRYVMYFFDPIEKNDGKFTRLDAALTLIKKVKFDYILTFSKSDAEEYGYEYMFTPYSKVVNDSSEIKHDMYFIGLAKDRIDIINDVSELSAENNVDAIIKLKPKLDGYSGAKVIDENIIVFDKVIPYEQSVKEMLECNCILEIVQEDQSDTTIRYHEALVYNKKLLTNNKSVVNLPFYDPKYIQIFNDPPEIDWDWVKKREAVNYGYDGRFSPESVLDKLVSLEKERKEQTT